MRCTQVTSVLLFAALVSAYDNLPAQAASHREGHNLHVRQGGIDGRCGSQAGGASCAEGYCCSSTGQCGQGSAFCAAPDSQFLYGPANDANQLPSGGSTRPIPRPQLGSIPYGQSLYSCLEPGTVAITFEDGPYNFTPDILDQFAAYNMKATFFITGNNLGKGAIDNYGSNPWAAIIRRMVAEGHQVASHTWSHQDLNTLTTQQRYDQIIKNEMAISNIIGKFPTYLRPPYNSCNAGCITDLGALGYVVAFFDLDTNDNENASPDLIQNSKNNFQRSIGPSNPARDSFLTIAHEVNEQTAHNLTAYMLDLIASKGYRGVTIGECLGEPEANWYRAATGRVATSSAFTPPAGTPTPSISVGSSTLSDILTSTVSSSLIHSITESFSSVASPISSVSSTPTQFLSSTISLTTSTSLSASTDVPRSSTASPISTGSSSVSVPSTAQSRSSSRSLSVSDSTSQSTTPSPFPKASSLGFVTLSGQLVSYTNSTVRSVPTPRTTVSSTAPSSTPSRIISPDGTCGGPKGYTCVGYYEGECCSQYGWCGRSSRHCDSKCNPLFGKCPGSGSSSGSSTSSRASSISSHASSASSHILRSSTASSASVSTPSSETSRDGTCGGPKGYTCINYYEGECCSQYGWCGRSSRHCDSKCNPLFGKCPGGSSMVTSTRPYTTTPQAASTPTNAVSEDGKCGPSNGNTTCKGSPYGSCCSQHGWCGYTRDHCSTGCRSSFGSCDSRN